MNDKKIVVNDILKLIKDTKLYFEIIEEGSGASFLIAPAGSPACNNFKNAEVKKNKLSIYK